MGARRAAAIQAQLTAHTLAAAQQLHNLRSGAGHLPPPDLVLAVDGLGNRAAQRWRATFQGTRMRRQGRGSLAVRLQRQLGHARREGARAVVVVGSDLPTLQPSDLLAAFVALEQVPDRADEVAAELAEHLHRGPFRLTREISKGALVDRLRASLADDLASFDVAN